MVILNVGSDFAGETFNISLLIMLGLLIFTFPFFSFFKKILNVYLFLRETEHELWGGAEREGDTEWEAGSRLQAVSTEPDTGLELTDREIMT